MTKRRHRKRKRKNPDTSTLLLVGGGAAAVYFLWLKPKMDQEAAMRAAAAAAAGQPPPRRSLFGELASLVAAGYEKRKQESAQKKVASRYKLMAQNSSRWCVDTQTGGNVALRYCGVS